MNNRVKTAIITVATVLFAVAVISLIICMSVAGACVATALNLTSQSGKGYGSGAIVLEQSTLRVLFADGENVRLYPASTTKVLTALVVINSLPLDTKVKITAESVGIEGSSIYLREGEILSVEELLYGLMLRSGNDAATALALAVSPTISAFAELMNKTAKECGAVSSSFVNPHGLHDDNHFTTAYDMAMITAKAFENPDFRRIVGARSAVIGEGESRRVIGNKNKMLKMYDGANGVKTGFTKKSGRCLVSAAKRDGMQLIAVVLNRGDMWNDSIRMLETAFSEYEMKDTLLAQFGAPNTATEIELSAEYSADGELRPRLYPLKKDGSEKIILAPAA